MNASPTTVRRNTRRYRAALETAENVVVHTLDNYFTAEECNPLALVRYMGGEANLTGKLTYRADRDRPFCLRVHSNLWFEFQATA